MDIRDEREFFFKTSIFQPAKETISNMALSISTAKSNILKAARKSDEMLEQYEWKRSCTVLRRESGSNPADLGDYFQLAAKVADALDILLKAQQEGEAEFMDGEPSPYNHSG